MGTNDHPELEVSVCTAITVLKSDGFSCSLTSTTNYNTVKMKHMAAYLLLGLGGNTSPSANDIKEVLASVGVETEQARVESLLKELEGKDINELIKEGTEKLASVPSGGAVAAAPAAGGAAPAAEAPAKKEEAKEESDEDMGFG